jgi:hypothetical protein
VIIAGGAYNTPQLLMLSGIGPRADLETLGIPVVLDRPAVGRFLQDRYEVAVITESPRDFRTLEDLTFEKPKPGEAPDRGLQEWLDSKKGLYATNGAILAIIRRSSPDLPDPDLFIFGLPATFKGYFPNYADTLEDKHNQFTWAILKAHTKNKGGRVTLRSTDPTERPEINFHYFDEGTDAAGDDLRAVVQGVKFAREFNKRLGVKSRPMVKDFVQPKPDIESDEQIAEWVKAEAWGHHACGTCRIGPKHDVTDSVLDAEFRVKGLEGLRVVDASVFPSIPGFFIVTSVYMIAEKASEAILADAGRPLPPVGPARIDAGPDGLIGRRGRMTQGSSAWPPCSGGRDAGPRRGVHANFPGGGDDPCDPGRVGGRAGPGVPAAVPAVAAGDHRLRRRPRGTTGRAGGDLRDRLRAARGGLRAAEPVLARPGDDAPQRLRGRRAAAGDGRSLSFFAAEAQGTAQDSAARTEAIDAFWADSRRASPRRPRPTPPGGWPVPAGDEPAVPALLLAPALLRPPSPACPARCCRPWSARRGPGPGWGRRGPSRANLWAGCSASRSGPAGPPWASPSWWG